MVVDARTLEDEAGRGNLMGKYKYSVINRPVVYMLKTISVSLNKL